MDQPAGALLRWCRASLLGAVAMTTGVLAHLSADGLLPGTPTLGLILAGCIAIAAVFLGRPASRLRVVTLLVGGQTFVHGALTAAAGHRGDPPLVRAVAARPNPAPAPVHRPGPRVGSLADQFYAAHPAERHAPLTVPYPVQHLLADMTGPHAVMALAHLVAAVAVGLWLARGEQALWAQLALVAGHAQRFLEPALTRWRHWICAIQQQAIALVDLLRRPARDRAEPLTPTPCGLTRSVERRGPPVLHAV